MKLNKFKKAKAINAVVLPNVCRKWHSSKKTNGMLKRPLSRKNLRTNA